MQFFFPVLCLYISVQDLRKGIISHRTLLMLAPFCLFYFDPTSITRVMIALLVLLILAITTDIGGGDIKLMAILIVTQGAVWIRAESIPIVLISSSALLLGFFIYRRAVPERVPLAPVILAPVAVFYLAI